MDIVNRHTGAVSTLEDRILEAIRHRPLDDDVLAELLGVNHRQQVNIVARGLRDRGLIRRVDGPDGKIVNAITDAGAAVPAPDEPRVPTGEQSDLISEDTIKAACRDFLTGLGFEVNVAWGRTRGVDIEARHPDGRRWLIEAKGEVASQQQQTNYFLGALGELVQRMDVPDAIYALALPDNRVYRGLVQRLPAFAVDRLGLRVLWVRVTPSATTVNEQTWT